jgi:hypothetical protein|eukprot:COSAG02_NODE_5486_length_4288_cov_1.915493_5_plen_33_part_00
MDAMSEAIEGMSTCASNFGPIAANSKQLLAFQ